MPESYTIPLAGLKEGRQTFDFEIRGSFFEHFEESEIKEGRLIAKVETDRSTSHIDLTISISGSVMICCDRCLEIFSHPVDCSNRLIVRFGKNNEDYDPDIITAHVGGPELDLKQHFYEFILLDLPIRRVHPDDKNGKSTCNPEMLEKLNEHLVEQEKHDDPRWDKLKKLMSDN